MAIKNEQSRDTQDDDKQNTTLKRFVTRTPPKSKTFWQRSNHNPFMCIRHKTWQGSVNLAFIKVVKPHTHKLYILKHCIDIDIIGQDLVVVIIHCTLSKQGVKMIFSLNVYSCYEI